MKLLAAIMLGAACNASANRRLQDWGQWQTVGSSSGSDNWGSPSTEWGAPFTGNSGWKPLDGTSGWQPSTGGSSGWKPSTSGSSGWNPSTGGSSGWKPSTGQNSRSTSTRTSTFNGKTVKTVTVKEGNKTTVTTTTTMPDGSQTAKLTISGGSIDNSGESSGEWPDFGGNFGEETETDFSGNFGESSGEWPDFGGNFGEETETPEPTTTPTRPTPTPTRPTPTPTRPTPTPTRPTPTPTRPTPTPTRPTPTPTRPTPTPTNRATMRMAGTDELLAFNEQNRIRTNPRAVQQVVKEQIRWFGNSRTMMRQPNGVNMRTNAGIGEWQEADRELGRQRTFEPLKWNDYLALACEDHCKDTGPSGRTGHSGSDGSTPWKRMNRYGKWGGRVGENIAYGNSDGAEYMVQLYIDDGVANRGHRVNILKPDFKETGMAVCPHRGFKKQIVIAYAGSFTPSAFGRSEVARRAKN